jgi:pyruvate dehydrogenase E2 component (dihydrolipoamide acetyltransferase)
MYGVRNFSAIINPPQACILAVGGPQSVVSWQGRTAVQESVMTVTLSADSRVVGEESAAEFLQAFVLYIENPALLMYI